MSFLVYYYGRKNKDAEINQKIYSQAEGADKASIFGREKTGRINQRDV